MENQHAQEHRENDSGSYEDKMTVLSWKAPSRLFKKRDRVFFQTVIALVIIIALILFLINEFLLIGVVLAVAFVSYVLATVPPKEIENKITRKGIETAGFVNRWEELNGFWFDEKWGQQMVVIEKKTGFPNTLIILLGNADKKTIKEKLNEHISFLLPPDKAWVDNAADWLHRHLPFDKV